MPKKNSDICRYILRKLEWVKYHYYINIKDNEIIESNYHMNIILNEYQKNPEHDEQNKKRNRTNDEPPMRKQRNNVNHYQLSAVKGRKKNPSKMWNFFYLPIMEKNQSIAKKVTYGFVSMQVNDFVSENNRNYSEFLCKWNNYEQTKKLIIDSFQER